jgi:hypothetical protein
MLFKNPVRTSKRTPHLTITKINWLTLFKEIIAVYSENHTEPINIKCKSYLMLMRLVHIETIRLEKVKQPLELHFKTITDKKSNITFVN